MFYAKTDNLEKLAKTSTILIIIWKKKSCTASDDHNQSGAPNEQFLENICSEDDLRSRIFGTFVVKFERTFTIFVVKL